MNKRFTPLFSAPLLARHMLSFKLSSVPHINRIHLELKILIGEWKSGKLASLKEEEVKSRFITTFFGDVLGFSYSGAEKWHIREEKKSTVDGTKPDAVLGYVSAEKGQDQVRVVIEIKDAQTDLDESQRRANNQSPVEQAFGYVPKMGGECRWVVVSNLIEIRFYAAADMSKYQGYLLRELDQEEKLRELLFLFHKDSFLKQDGYSPTERFLERSKHLLPSEDKPLHIIDQLFYALQKFNGLRFVDPEFLSAIRPFNILDEHVWHYKDQTLFTLNPEIYSLLMELDSQDGEIIMSDKLLQEADAAGVLEVHDKLSHIFRFLNQCFIHHLTAVKDYKSIQARNKHTIGFSHRMPFSFTKDEGTTKNILLTKDEPCDCIACNYRNFDFRRLLVKLKTGEGNEAFDTPEYAYGDYIVSTNNYKSVFNRLRRMERSTKGISAQGVAYFLAKHNLQTLHNLVSDYSFDDRKDILNYIRDIDLDKVVYEEIEFDVDKDVRKYLLKLRDDHLVYKLQDDIGETVEDIQKLKISYNRGGGQTAGPNLWATLLDQLILLYLHINLNYIIYDEFKRYRLLVTKIFQGLIWSYQTPAWGLPSFDSFILTEAVLFVSRENLKKILQDVPELKTDENSVHEMLQKLENLTSSYSDDGFFGDPHPNDLLRSQLMNRRFATKYGDIFGNLFQILSRLPISADKFEPCKKTLMKFLKIEEAIYWYQVEAFITFIDKKGNLFSAVELEDLLALAIRKHWYGMNKYNELIRHLPDILHYYYPEHRISNLQLVNSAILASSSEDGQQRNFMTLIPLANVCNEAGRQLLCQCFEADLNKEFRPDFFEDLIEQTDYDINTNNYFEKYVTHINLHKSERSIGFGKYKFTSLVFIKFALILYRKKVDRNRRELSHLTNINAFETWLVNPAAFDYSSFDAKWLIDLRGLGILEQLTEFEAIAPALEEELKRKFDPLLAEIKYTYFQEIFKKES